MTKVVANEKEKIATEKKPLKDVLATYLEKKGQEKSIKKIKQDFSELKLNFKETKTTFETLIEIQKKLKLAYNKTSVTKNGDKKTKKNN
ncbi:MAG: hypothetical protein K1060chlam1_00710 [Candidatus Anoxychlamydiales bacterium]|nr:hypothetical protein [Candidatus Anoxychlamydiales bacterium]